MIIYRYESEAQFSNDIRLIFDNCKIFNEDDSVIGKAGQALRRYFNRRWKEMKDGILTPTKRTKKKSTEDRPLIDDAQRQTPAPARSDVAE